MGAGIQTRKQTWATADCRLGVFLPTVTSAMFCALNGEMHFKMQLETKVEGPVNDFPHTLHGELVGASATMGGEIPNGNWQERPTHFERKPVGAPTRKQSRIAHLDLQDVPLLAVVRVRHEQGACVTSTALASACNTSQFGRKKAKWGTTTRT